MGGKLCCFESKLDNSAIPSFSREQRPNSYRSYLSHSDLAPESLHPSIYDDPFSSPLHPYKHEHKPHRDTGSSLDIWTTWGHFTSGRCSGGVHSELSDSQCPLDPRQKCCSVDDCSKSLLDVNGNLLRIIPDIYVTDSEPQQLERWSSPEIQTTITTTTTYSTTSSTTTTTSPKQCDNEYRNIISDSDSISISGTTPTDDVKILTSSPASPEPSPVQAQSPAPSPAPSPPLQSPPVATTGSTTFINPDVLMDKDKLHLSLFHYIISNLQQYGPDHVPLINGLTGTKSTTSEIRKHITNTRTSLVARKFPILPLTNQKPESRARVVCVMCRNSLDVATAVLAVMSLGAAVSFIDPASSTGEIRDHFRLVEGSGFFVDSDLLHLLPQELLRNNHFKSLIVTFGEASQGQGHDWLNFKELRADDRYIFTHTLECNVSIEVTSHTAIVGVSYDLDDTGNVVKLTHAQIVANLEQMRYCSQLHHGNGTVLSIVPYHLHYGLIGVLLHHMCNGATQIVLQEWKTRRVLRACHLYNVTTVPVLSSWLSKLLVAARISGGFLCAKHVILHNNGHIHNQEKLQQLIMRGTSRITKLYGLNECTFCVGVQQVYPNSATGWTLLSSTDCKIIPIESTYCDPAVTSSTSDLQRSGHVYIRGPQIVMTSPRGMPKHHYVMENTGWFCTGDVGTLDKQGRLQISSPDGGGDGGRESLNNDVTDLLLRHPGITDAYVIEDGVTSRRTAVIECRMTYSDLSTEDLRQLVKLNTGSSYLSDIRFVGHIPRATSGRVLTNHLLADINKPLDA